MNKLNYAVAMLTVGGALGAVDRAVADTVFTDTLNISVDAPLQQITVLGSTPQFDYGSFEGVLTEFGTDFEINDGALNSGVGLKSSTPGLPAPGETYDSTTKYATAVEGDLLTPAYIHLDFIFDGQEYIGVANIDATGTLDSIQYTAVPEPEAWALLIAGAAFAGGALRRARQRQSLAMG